MHQQAVVNHHHPSLPSTPSPASVQHLSHLPQDDVMPSNDDDVPSLPPPSSSLLQHPLSAPVFWNASEEEKHKIRAQGEGGGNKGGGRRCQIGVAKGVEGLRLRIKPFPGWKSVTVVRWDLCWKRGRCIRKGTKKVFWKIMFLIKRIMYKKYKVTIGEECLALSVPLITQCVTSVPMGARKFNLPPF